MRLKQLIKSLGDCRVYPQTQDFEVKGISCDSKKAGNNSIFVAIKGVRTDGHRFIEEAVSKGAKAVIAQSAEHRAQSTGKASFIIVEDTRKALAKLAEEFYGHPSQKIKVVGVTGTNGKTTVTYLIEAILKKAGFSPAVIGTVNYRFKDKVIPAKNTTPGPLEIQSMLSEMLKGGVDYVAMEVSSHALAQDRVAGVNFSSAIFTNLTQDHLDYHKTLGNYFQAKAKLFKDISPKSFSVINRDDKYGRRLQGLAMSRVVTYGIKNNAAVMAKEIKLAASHTEFLITAGKTRLSLKTRLIGLHNVYNVLAAAAWALNESLDLSGIKSALEKFKLVPGRLEKIDFKGDFSVFVDYAHTEDALKNVLKALRQVSSQRIIVVFGCGGERDKAKRPKMGAVVTGLADYAIVTNDNPRGEDPQDIIKDISRGIRKNNYCVIPGRFRAIKKSLSLAKSGDIILVAGKGHEDYQILKDKRVHFDDREAVRECLRSMNY